MSQIERFAQRYDLSPDRLRRWLVEAMVLGAAADGNVDRRESEEIVHIVTTQADFAELNAGELQSTLNDSVESLRRDGFRPRVHALAGALPRYAHRVLAFRVALQVAFADGRINDDEFGLLREMQAVLGIAEGDVALAVEDAQAEHGDVVPRQLEPIEAYLDCMLMAAAVDGELQDEELATIIAFIIDREEFDALDGELIRGYIDENANRFTSTREVERRLDTLRDDCPLPEQRENAWALAAQVVAADGEVGDDEKRLLRQLHEALELDQAREEIAGRFAELK